MCSCRINNSSQSLIDTSDSSVHSDIQGTTSPQNSLIFNSFNELENPELIEETPYYQVWYGNNQKSFIYIFDKNGNPIKGEGYNGRSPKLSIVEKGLVKLRLQAGTGNSTAWCYYYDIDQNKFSETFYNVLGEKGNLVVLADKQNIIVRNIFDADAFYKEITTFSHPLSKSTDPFLTVEFVNEKQISITYLSGEDFEKITETIDLS